MDAEGALWKNLAGVNTDTKTCLLGNWVVVYAGMV